MTMKETAIQEQARLHAEHCAAQRVRVEFVATSAGWCWTLHMPLCEPVSFAMQKTEYGARGATPGEVYDCFPEDLAEAIEDGDTLAICDWIATREASQARKAQP
jgi:hypothetical protein